MSFSSFWLCLGCDTEQTAQQLPVLFEGGRGGGAHRGDGGHDLPAHTTDLIVSHMKVKEVQDCFAAHMDGACRVRHD